MRRWAEAKTRKTRDAYGDTTLGFSIQTCGKSPEVKAPLPSIRPNSRKGPAFAGPFHLPSSQAFIESGFWKPRMRRSSFPSASSRSTVG